MVTHVRLTQGHVALVDAADLELVQQYSWQLFKSGPKPNATPKLYAQCFVGRKSIKMHRLIMGIDDERLVDHRDGDGLDNRRHNLRIATPTQNAANRRKHRGESRFKGVYWNAERGLWQASIGGGIVDGRRTVKFIGRFVSEEEAARAYDEVALKTHGEFAVLNFKQETMR